MLSIPLVVMHRDVDNYLSLPFRSPHSKVNWQRNINRSHVHHSRRVQSMLPTPRARGLVNSVKVSKGEDLELSAGREWLLSRYAGDQSEGKHSKQKETACLVTSEDE